MDVGNHWLHLNLAELFILLSTSMSSNCLDAIYKWDYSVTVFLYMQTSLGRISPDFALLSQMATLYMSGLHFLYPTDACISCLCNLTWWTLSTLSLINQFISFECESRIEEADHVGYLLCILEGTTCCFDASGMQGFLFSMSSTAFSLVLWKQPFQQVWSDSSFPFLYDKGCYAHFHTHVVHLYVFFWELSTQVFCPFLFGLLCLHCTPLVRAGATSG